MRLASAAVCFTALGLVYACGGSGGSGGSGGDGPNGGSANVGGSVNAGGSAQAGAGTGARAGSGGTQNGTAGQTQGGGGSANNGGGGAGAGAGGSPSDPDGGDIELCSGFTADLIDLSKTLFMDYGKLRVGFKQTVDATKLSVRVMPTGKLTTTAITRVDDTTVDVTLGYYHLPRDYQIQAAAISNGVQACGSVTLPGDDNGSRIGFLSQATGPGDFKSWPTAATNAVTPRDAADSVCQSEAEAAGFKGKFVAFLSARGAYDAACRALGLDGTVATSCGQSALPVDHAPILNLFGLPMVDGATNIAASNWNTSMSYRLDGTDPNQQDTWTGSMSGAVASSMNNDCMGWTSETGLASVFGFTSLSLPEYGQGADNCNPGNRKVGLMCLQVGSKFFGPNTLHLLTGKRAFVTQGTLTGAMSFGGMTGVAAADALCQSEANTSHLDTPTHFRAYVGTTAIDPMCHVLGKGAKTDDMCGLAAWPTDVWSRTDGFPIGSADDLVNGNPTGPISLAADKSLQLEMNPWVTVTTDQETTCQDWTSDSASIKADVGDTSWTDSGWSDFSSATCDSEQPVYCFEQ